MRFKEGDIVKVVANTTAHEFRIGEHVRITVTDEDLGEYTAEHLDGSDFWYLDEEEVESIN
mgnify:CR=1 FL=1